MLTRDAEGMRMKLDRVDHLSTDLIGLDPRDIRHVFPHPTFVSIKGRNQQPLFISALLHGNELTSFRILQRLAARYKNKAPARSLLIFIGNVDAAAEGVRHLPHQPDFNRIWAKGESAYHALTADVTAIAREAAPFASIDIHNNTGANPIYGCVNALRPADLQLAASFAPLGVFYLNPPTTQSIAFSHFCPAITIECGKGDDPIGLEAADRLIENTIALERFSDTPLPDDALTLYETVGRMVVDPACSFSFGAGGTDGADSAGGADVQFRPDLDKLNFVDLDENTALARCRPEKRPIHVLDEHGTDITTEFIHYTDGNAHLTTKATPSMISHDPDIIRQDCLGYLMRPLNLDLPK